MLDELAASGSRDYTFIQSAEQRKDRQKGLEMGHLAASALDAHGPRLCLRQLRSWLFLNNNRIELKYLCLYVKMCYKNVDRKSAIKAYNKIEL